MRFLIAAAMVLGLMSATANAQTTTQTSASGASAGAVSNINLIQPGVNTNGNGGVGYLNTNVSGVVWTLGNTPSMASQSYDACLKNLSIAGPGAGINIPLEIAVCWNLRMMDAMAKYPPGSNQYEMGCLDSNWQKVDWDTGTLACSANKTKLARTNPNDPRAMPVRGTPVVVAGHGAVMPAATVPQNAVPPTGTNIPAPNRPNLSAAPANGAAVPVRQEVCYDRAGNIVPAGTRGASCGFAG
jgi:hypothetical protein